MEVTNVFTKNLKAFNNKESLIINQGGTRSSKTYSILQLLFLIAESSEEKLIISVVSRTLPHLKLGAMRDFDNILLNYEIIPDKIKNKTESYYNINKSIIEFFGADDSSKVHGPARNILFINEANFIKKEIFEQLEIRTTGIIFLDYNPTQEFWVHTDLMTTNKHTFIKSTYKDNPFLSEKQIQRIEAKRGNENWWKVYGEGEIGYLEGMIFTNWIFGDFDENLSFYYGLDFGYNPDPDAFLKVAIDEKRKKIYVKELFYINDQTPTDLEKSLKKAIGKQNSLIIADSAEKRLISDLRQKGFNIKSTKKGAGSIKEGIRIVQDYQLIIDKNSVNLEKELRNYVWNDKKAGIPIDDFNHLLDGLRYIVFTQTKRSEWEY
ncbi:MAG: terminase [Deltaproteobacteria bacterium]|nr:terminase [Deltaproteobacteria bacterium]